MLVLWTPLQVKCYHLPSIVSSFRFTKWSRQQMESKLWSNAQIWYCRKKNVGWELIESLLSAISVWSHVSDSLSQDSSRKKKKKKKEKKTSPEGFRCTSLKNMEFHSSNTLFPNSTVKTKHMPQLQNSWPWNHHDSSWNCVTAGKMGGWQHHIKHHISPWDADLLKEQSSGSVICSLS